MGKRPYFSSKSTQSVGITPYLLMAYKKAPRTRVLRRIAGTQRLMLAFSRMSSPNSASMPLSALAHAHASFQFGQARHASVVSHALHLYPGRSSYRQPTSPGVSSYK